MAKNKEKTETSQKVTNLRQTVPRSQKIALTKKIVELYEQGTYTVKSCCEAVGVDYDAFMKWKNNSGRGYVEEVAVLFNKAKEPRDINFRDKLKEGSRGGLLKLITGNTYTEVTVEKKVDENGLETIVSTKEVTKTVQPNPTAVIFALKNVDAENFKDDIHHAGTIKIERYDQLTDREIDEKIAAAEAKVRSTMTKDKEQGNGSEGA